MSHTKSSILFHIMRPISCTRKYRLHPNPPFNSDNAIRTHYSITGNTITKNSIPQLGHNHYLMSLILYYSIECSCPGYIDIKTIKPTLVLITMTEVCSIFTSDFMISAINAFTSKLPLILCRNKFNPLMYLFQPPVQFQTCVWLHTHQYNKGKIWLHS